MAQIFHRSTNTIAKVSIIVGVTLAISALVLGGILDRSPYYTQVGVVRAQPVPFSHKHHVAGLGIDCRFCHTSVEESSFAGIPSTETCMKCHSEMWKDSPMLEPVRESFRTGESLEWVRVHDTPDFVYFDHSIHVNKGIGCVTCHGQVDQMPLMAKAETLHMQWCLDCHRNPENFVRPKEHVFDMNWESEEDQAVLGPRLVDEYNIKPSTNCSVCHR